MPIKMPQKELDVLSLLLRSEQPMTISDKEEIDRLESILENFKKKTSGGV